MTKPDLYWPVKPLHINQPFGANPEYYAKFLDIYGNPEKGHQGIDLMAFHGQPVYAAHDGDAIYLKDKHGGEGIWVYGDGFATIYWHLIGDTDPTYAIPIPFDQERHPVKAGDLIGYADNTGAPFESSGDHLHFGFIFINPNGTVSNSDNGYGGCVDPAPYINGKFAQDIPRDLPYIRRLLKAAKSILFAKFPSLLQPSKQEN